MSAVVPQAGSDLATDERAAHERAQCDERGRDRETCRPRERESQEHHIAGHVRDEDVTEQQVAEGVDEAGDDRQPDQQRRELAVPAGATGDDRLSYFVDELAYGCHGRQWPWHTCAKRSATSDQLVTFQVVPTYAARS